MRLLLLFFGAILAFLAVRDGLCTARCLRPRRLEQFVCIVCLVVLRCWVGYLSDPCTAYAVPIFDLRERLHHLIFVMRCSEVDWVVILLRIVQHVDLR